MLRSWLAIALLAALLPGQAQAATLRVQADGLGEYPTLQTAIDAAAVGDTVLAMPGTYTGEGNKNLDFQGKDLCLIGAGGPEETIIDCEFEGRGAYFGNGESRAAVLQGFTIRNGLSIDESKGAGIRCESDPSLLDLVIEDCQANYTGGLSINWGSPLVKGVSIRGCSTSDYGGGAMVCNGSTAEFEDVEFVGNTGFCGGGVEVCNSTVAFRNVGFVGNAAGFQGGAAHCSGGTVFEDCTFVDNHSGHYGGAVRGGGVTLNRCLFVGNSTDGVGGAVCLLWDYGTSIVDCAFVENAAAAGGAIYIGEAPNQGPVSTVMGCSFRGNLASGGAGSAVCANWGGLLAIQGSLLAYNPGGVGIYSNHGADIDLSCCDVYGNTPWNYGGDLTDQTGLDGNISQDPLFCVAEGEDLTVASLSPCLPGNNDCGVQMGAFGLGCTLTGVEEASPQYPMLGANYPNPFNPSTTIPFSLDAPATVSVSVLDVTGRLVTTLAREQDYPAGRHELLWGGRDDAGRAMPSGVYFYRLGTQSGAAALPMLLVK